MGCRHTWRRMFGRAKDREAVETRYTNKKRRFPTVIKILEAAGYSSRGCTFIPVDR